MRCVPEAHARARVWLARGWRVAGAQLGAIAAAAWTAPRGCVSARTREPAAERNGILPASATTVRPSVRPTPPPTAASFFVRYLLSWVREPNPSFAGWVVACFFFAACIALSVTLQQVNVLSSRLGSRVSAALAAELYEKSLREDRLSNPCPVDVVSLVATDCTKLQEAGSSINFLWSAVVESLAIIAVLLGLIGVSALPGLGLILLIIPAQVRARARSLLVVRHGRAAIDTRAHVYIRVVWLAAQQ